jgi:hypothetical protein
LKWDTSAWGKIPANFAREHPLINPCLQTVQQRQTIESSVNLTASRSIEQRVNVVAFRGEVIRDRPKDIRAFVPGWLQALSYWETNIPEGNEIASKALNIPSNTISFEGLDLTDFA